MDNSKKLSEILKKSGSPHIYKPEKKQSSSLLASLQSISCQQSHSFNSYKNLDSTLADLRGYIAKALCLKEYDDRSFEQKKEIAENELQFLYDLWRQIPELRKKLEAAQDKLKKLEAIYKENMK